MRWGGGAGFYFDSDSISARMISKASGRGGQLIDDSNDATLAPPPPPGDGGEGVKIYGGGMVS